MEKGLYAIYDKVAKEYGPLFEAKNAQVAHRSFVTEIPQQYKQNLVDYKLVEFGSFDSENGKFVIHDDPIDVVIDEVIVEKENA